MKERINLKKAAASAEAFLALGGLGAGAAFVAGAEATPAAAANLSATNHEAMSPREFLASVEKRRIALANEIRGLPGVQTYPSPQASAEDNALMRANAPGDKFYKLSIPSTQYKGRYNSFELLYDSKHRLLSLNFHPNNDRPGFDLGPGKPETSIGTAWNLNQNIPLTDEFMPDTIYLDSANEQQVFNRYVVGKPFEESSVTNVLNYGSSANNAKVVASRFNNFFTLAQKIIKPYKKSHS